MICILSFPICTIQKRHENPCLYVIVQLQKIKKIIKIVEEERRRKRRKKEKEGKNAEEVGVVEEDNPEVQEASVVAEEEEPTAQAFKGNKRFSTK